MTKDLCKKSTVRHHEFKNNKLDIQVYKFNLTASITSQ